MNMKKTATAMAVGLALSVAAAASSAALMKFEDDDLDFLLRPSGDQNWQKQPINGNTDFQLGDILVSVFEIGVHTIDGVNKIPPGQELTGVAAIQITGISGTTIGSTITFGAVGDTGLDGILAANGINFGMPLGAGAAVAMFFNRTDGVGNDKDLKIGLADGNPQGNPSCTNLSDCLEQATLGEKYQVDGFLGDPDEFWQAVIVASGGANPGTVLNINSSFLVASFNGALSNLFQGGGLKIGPTNIVNGLPGPCVTGIDGKDGCVTGGTFSGSITGGQGIPLAHGAFAHSDFDGTKNTIPEPATLLLLASGLLGISASRWARKA